MAVRQGAKNSINNAVYLLLHCVIMKYGVLYAYEVKNHDIRRLEYIEVHYRNTETCEIEFLMEEIYWPDDTKSDYRYDSITQHFGPAIYI
jgi:hypothetical protein